MSTPQDAPAALRVLCVDDEAGIRFVYENEVPLIADGGDGDVTVCENGTDAIAALDAAVAGGRPYDAALVDLRMPGGPDGWAVAEHLNQVSPGTKFVICTGHGDLPEAKRAIAMGAFGFLEKPLQMAELQDVFVKVRIAKAEAAWPEEDRPGPVTLEVDDRDFIGSTPAMQALKKKLGKFAPSEASVLILGETGTGKEVVAKAIHANSARADGPFVAVNCGALPEHLVESEFFGHRKGAFTGADQPPQGPVRGRRRRDAVPGRAGRVAQADAGETAAVPGIERDPPGRGERDVQGRRADRLRHEQGLGGDGRRRGLSGRPDPPRERVRGAPPPAAGAGRGRAGAVRLPARPAGRARRRPVVHRPGGDGVAEKSRLARQRAGTGQRAGTRRDSRRRPRHPRRPARQRHGPAPWAPPR